MVTLWDGVLALPIIGTLDSARTQVVMESLLQRVVESGRARSVGARDEPAAHTRGGEILVRPMCSGSGERDGIEIVAVDGGPGMTDPARSRTDGYSTAGSLGYGLGTVERQSDFFDLYSHTNGTAIAAAICRDEPRRSSQNRTRYDVGAVHVAKAGEEVCGDNWAWRLRDGRLAILVADGLGHGLYAHEATSAALDVFAKEHEHAGIWFLTMALRVTRPPVSRSSITRCPPVV